MTDADKGDAIFDLRARRIACDWHGGQTSSLYALCSSGAIVEGVEAEITRDRADALRHGLSDYVLELNQLVHYVRAYGLRGAMANWDRNNRL